MNSQLLAKLMVTYQLIYVHFRFEVFFVMGSCCSAVGVGTLSWMEPHDQLSRFTLPKFNGVIIDSQMEQPSGLVDSVFPYIWLILLAQLSY